MASHSVGNDPCSIQRRWRVADIIARTVVAVEAQAIQIFSAEGIRWPGLWILSGYRSERRQIEVNPNNPNSLHSVCPSLAVDLRVGDLPASITPYEQWAFVGTLWMSHGGRWGGHFPTPDLNHFDFPLELAAGR